eukprot:6697759-Prymnesium_polylepis.1
MATEATTATAPLDSGLCTCQSTSTKDLKRTTCCSNSCLCRSSKDTPPCTCTGWLRSTQAEMAAVVAIQAAARANWAPDWLLGLSWALEKLVDLCSHQSYSRRCLCCLLCQM